MNQKSKVEQLFILLVACMGVFGLFALSGCGGRSCETPKSGSGEYLGGKATGVSIPGCGGCFSSGTGCDSCLWAQSCKLSSGTWEEKYEDADGNIVTDDASLKGCNIKYYGGGCLGCDQKEKSCYYGFININSTDDKLDGFFYGSTDGGEKLIGVANGCGGCVADGNAGAETLRDMEIIEGIN